MIQVNDVATGCKADATRGPRDELLREEKSKFKNFRIFWCYD